MAIETKKLMSRKLLINLILFNTLLEFNTIFYL